MRTKTVVDGKLLIEDAGVRFWFTREHIVRYIEKLETELAEWRNRLTLLGPAPAQQMEVRDACHCSETMLLSEGVLMRDWADDDDLIPPDEVSIQTN